MRASLSVADDERAAALTACPHCRHLCPLSPPRVHAVRCPFHMWAPLLRQPPQWPPPAASQTPSTPPPPFRGAGSVTLTIARSRTRSASTAPVSVAPTLGLPGTAYDTRHRAATADGPLRGGGRGSDGSGSGRRMLPSSQLPPVVAAPPPPMVDSGTCEHGVAPAAGGGEFRGRKVPRAHQHRGDSGRRALGRLACGPTCAIHLQKNRSMYSASSRLFRP